MISSKQLLEKTGISRATLNNYIKRGLIDKPTIRTGAEAGSGSARMGFFPEETVALIAQIKQSGSRASRDRINAPQPVTHPVAATRQLPGRAPSSFPEATHHATGRQVSLEYYAAPAYMVNNNFELIWWNEAAAEQLLPACKELPGELEERGLLKLLLEGPASSVAEGRLDNLIEAHLTAAHRRLSKEFVATLIAHITPRYRTRYTAMVDSLKKPDNNATQGYALFDPLDGSNCLGYTTLYVSYFREGLLFTYGNSQEVEFLCNILSQRPLLISDLLRNSKPHITPMAVLVADLQSSTNLCAELPAEEYFELINQIWQAAEPIFRKYSGAYGKHAGDGMLYYFLPQPERDYKLNAIECALELQQMMRDMTRKWQERKGWFNELNLNIGLHEGREWFGAFHAGPHVEFTVLGDTVNQAARLSDFARKGSIWATKSMINQIPALERKQIHFGVYREGSNGERRLVAQSYACIHTLHQGALEINHKFREIERLPITEILGYSAQS